MECQFCKKILSSLSALKYHQKSAKYCLVIQGNNNIENFCCEYCNKKFNTKQHLTTHYNSCKEKKKHKLEEEEENIKNLNLTLQDEIVKLKSQIKKLKDKYTKDVNKLKEEIYRMEGKLQVHENNQDCLYDIAKQSKITNTNINNKILSIQSSFDFNNTEHVKQLIEEKYDKNYLFQGQKGVAQFAVDYILKDDNGQLKYVCTDPSRQIFKYKDSEGFIKKDVEAKKLTGFLVNSGIQEKTHDVAIEFWTDENGDINGEKCSSLLETAQSIKNIKNDNTIFKKELINIIS
jgi:hypothetical protein